jgi:hypothetical protein
MFEGILSAFGGLGGGGGGGAATAPQTSGNKTFNRGVPAWALVAAIVLPFGLVALTAWLILRKKKG